MSRVTEAAETGVTGTIAGDKGPVLTVSEAKDRAKTSMTDLMESVVETSKRVAVEGPIAKVPTPETPPASIVVSRRLRNGRRAARDWDAWVVQVRELARMYPGFIALDELPIRGKSQQRTILYSFATPADLENWLESPTRRAWIERLDSIIVGQAVEQELVGVDSLHRHPAPKWKEVLVLLAAAVPVGRFVAWVTSHTALADSPNAIQVVTSTLMGVLAMNYLAGPTVLRLARRWLHRSR